mmetsp:Transcript_136418/g.236656  ORF Transcript_136418/g.236656 Transcript_136418/m.236656 type:complete len:296 (-) Transcript_136418:206-1093(-)
MIAVKALRSKVTALTYSQHHCSLQMKIRSGHHETHAQDYCVEVPINKSATEAINNNRAHLLTLQATVHRILIVHSPGDDDIQSRGPPRCGAQNMAPPKSVMHSEDWPMSSPQEPHGVSQHRSVLRELQRWGKRGCPKGTLEARHTLRRAHFANLHPSALVGRVKVREGSPEAKLHLAKWGGDGTAFLGRLRPISVGSPLVPPAGRTRFPQLLAPRHLWKASHHRRGPGQGTWSDSPFHCCEAAGDAIGCIARQHQRPIRLSLLDVKQAIVDQSAFVDDPLPTTLVRIIFHLKRRD